MSRYIVTLELDSPDGIPKRVAARAIVHSVVDAFTGTQFEVVENSVGVDFDDEIPVDVRERIAPYVRDPA